MDLERVLVFQSITGTIYLATITVVAVRLLLLARRSRELPELMLGLTLLVGGTLGATIEAGALTMRPTAAPELVGTMLLVGKCCGLVSLSCQGVFVWKVFRPAARWALPFIAAYVATAAAAIGGFWLHGTFSTGLVPMSWFWLELVARCAGSIWLVVESIHYYGLVRRRLRLGLAEPVLVNRFLLWAIAGVLGVAMLLTSVPPVLYPDSTHWLMVWDVAAFCVFGIGFSVAYSLVFFPPRFYRAWIGERAERQAA